MYLRRYFIVLIAICGLLLGPLARPTAARTVAPPVSATAATACAPSIGTASIAGTVRDPNGQPIPNAAVRLYEASSGLPWMEVYSTNAGHYAFTSLKAGNYLIWFDTFTTNNIYKSEWYSDKASRASATPIAVAAGTSLTDVNATLEVGTRITGQVTVSDTHSPLPNTLIRIYDSDEHIVAVGTTNASGVYTTTPGLPSGSYMLFFQPPSEQPYLAEYYTDKPDFATATPLTLSAPQVRAGVDAVLTRGAQIAGRVTAADTGLGLPNITVAISGSTEANNATSNTNSTGYYTATVALDTYRLTFFPPRSDISDYIATERTISVSTPTLHDNTSVALELGGQIKGRVTDTSTAPLQFVDVIVEGQNTDFYQVASTDAGGHYTFRGLPSGSYTVHFFGGSSYLDQYYQNQPDGTLATPISVTAPQPTSGIDAVMAQGGAISGRVTATDSGLGLKDVEVDVYDLAGDVIANTTTNAAGVYTTSTTLPSGAYRVQFVPKESSSACAYIPEYYNNQPILASSTPISVIAATTTPNINAELARGSAISGRVTAEGSGAGLYAVIVVIYDSNGEQVASTYTDLSGHYRTMPALPSGSYRVGFFSYYAPYLTEYYPNRPSLLAADPISVTVPNDTTDVDAVLALGGAISGNVKAADTDAPLEHISIEVYDQAGAAVANGSTNARGNYTTSALPSGSYRLRFVPSEGSISQYSPEYYNDQPTLATATTISITTTNTTAGINATLSKGTLLTGQIHAPGSSNPSDVRVDVYDSSGAVVATGKTNALGFYQVAPALPSGSYRIGFVPRADSGFAASFYRGKLSLADAEVINVTAPNPRGGLDDTLLRAAAAPGTLYLPNILR